MKRKAHGAQEPRHIWKYVEATSAAQRGDSPAQAINQRFLNRVRAENILRTGTNFTTCSAELAGNPPL